MTLENYKEAINDIKNKNYNEYNEYNEEISKDLNFLKNYYDIDNVISKLIEKNNKTVYDDLTYIIHTPKVDKRKYFQSWLAHSKTTLRNNRLKVVKNFMTQLANRKIQIRIARKNWFDKLHLRRKQIKEKRQLAKLVAVQQVLKEILL